MCGVANHGLPKRFHLNRPDLADDVVQALTEREDIKSQQRLLARSKLGVGPPVATPVLSLASRVNPVAVLRAFFRALGTP